MDVSDLFPKASDFFFLYASTEPGEMVDRILSFIF